MKNYTILFLLFSSLTVNIQASTGKKVILNLNKISTGSGDVTEIYFNPGTSPAYRSPEDARKNFDTLGVQIYSLTNDLVPCYSNGIGDEAVSVVIALGLRVNQTGAYVISASKLYNFDPSSFIQLEDRKLRTLVDLKQHADTVQMDKIGQNEGRFYLHVSSPPVLSAISTGCNNNDGIINVNQDGAIRWSSVLLFDSNGTVVQTLSDTLASFSFGKLNGGSYYVVFAYGENKFIKNIYVASHQVLLSITASVTEAEVGQTIQFYSQANNTNQYTWYFGDSSIITGVANPGYEYYESGTYTVSLHASNAFQCSADAYVTIPVVAQMTTSVSGITNEGINVFSDNKDVIITTSKIIASPYICEIYNLAGQLLATAPVTSSYFVLNLANEAPGIYFVQVKTSSGSFTKKIFLGHI